ncbi:C6 zinc finger domain-containing protein [Apiospora kogelbergensis]|uniref:C6 zinc finger domain-containing protein n=1 Tax=Apiospora kogelbergensis TaxID=1337665 RepID=UPI00312E3A2E
MADSPDSSPKQHCWECRRRCLVCDFTTPSCKRCIASGVACPGYGTVKPVRFQWLPPGKVKLRRRKPVDTAEPAENGALKSKTKPAAKSVPLAPPAQTGELAQTSAIPASFPREPPRLAQNFNLRVLTESLEYFNACILHDLLPITQLGPNPYLYEISEHHLQQAIYRPDYIHYGLLCNVLTIGSLSEHLADEGGQRSDAILAGVMTVLLLDIHHGVSQNWRMHLEGMHQLVALRGGFEALGTLDHMEQFVHCLWQFMLTSCYSLAVMGNTTCSALDMGSTNIHLENLDFIMAKYSGSISSFGFCPPPLIAETVRINHLRWRAATSENMTALDLWREAYDILGRIYDFSPEQWATSKPLSQDHWTLIGNMFWASVALYCISSLQRMTEPPIEVSTPAQRTTHVQFLYLCLAEAVALPSVRSCTLWPLVVLGVEAAGSDDDSNRAEIRAFVAQQLEQLSRHSGTFVPLTAKRVLETFWRSGETAWDACFDKPYAMTLLISVDIHKMMSPGS